MSGWGWVWGIKELRSQEVKSAPGRMLWGRSLLTDTWVSGIGPVLQESKPRLQGVKKVDPNCVNGSVLETSSHAFCVPVGKEQSWVSTKPVSFHTSLPHSRKKPRYSILIILLYEGTFSALGVINRFKYRLRRDSL